MIRIRLIVLGCLSTLAACSSPPDAHSAIKATLADADASIVFVTPKDSESPEAKTFSDGGQDATLAKDTASAPTCAFPANPAPGEAGSACTTASDCDSGLCVESAEGRICTQACVDCCPGGMHCAQMPGIDSAFACLPTLTALCRPCLTDAECGALNEGALCVASGTEGSFCGGACDADAQCPQSYACKAVAGQKGAGKQCVRTQGSCSCSAKATSDGAATSCSFSNTAGTCKGTRTCGLDGLSACSAPQPATETCNDIDDNCDGVTDGAGSLGCATFYQDSDGDGFGIGIGTCLCKAEGLSTAVKGGDCNDALVAVHPGSAEVCNGIDDDCNGLTDDGVGQTFYPDADQDGYGATSGTTQACKAPAGYIGLTGDCDDMKPSVHPGGSEVCNGLDDNCDGQTDEGMQKTYFADADGDGYGKFGTAILACTAPLGYASNGIDCNDLVAAINPGAAEVCNSIDDNCSGQTDEGFVGKTWYADADADGYGNALSSTQACSAPGGYVAGGGDCDDTKSGVHPAALETCNGADDNCDGQTDEGVLKTYFADGDGDGYGDASAPLFACTKPAASSINNADCDDLLPSVHPKAAEVCNGQDDNCDGSVDEGVKTTFYVDGDGDGFGSAAATTLGCSVPPGYAPTSSDCDDAKPGVHPGAKESCNTLDDDCNGLTDDGLPAQTWYQDADGDGFGNAAESVFGCKQPGGYVGNGSDCADANAYVHPGAAESCNDIDDNCSGETDEGLTFLVWHMDADGDGYGDLKKQKTACAPLPGAVTDATDCDDTKLSVHPGAFEVCNAIDDDCNGVTDDGLLTEYYQDNDGDSYGNAAASTLACTQPAGYGINPADCDDTKSGVHPGATEACNGLDDDCNGVTDDGMGGSTWYQDVDGDTFGNPGAAQTACSAPIGYVATGGDCDDSAFAIHPGALEVCNSIDDDCNGVTDDGSGSLWYADVDGDSYGDPASSLAACTQPGGYVANTGDCNDAANAVHPGAAEVCNGVDDNCEGRIDEGVKATFYLDSDADTYGNAAKPLVACVNPGGYATNGTDCDDASAAIHPGAAEVCNSKDDNCNGQTDEGLGAKIYYQDADGDGYGNPAATTSACTQPTGYVTNANDCNDSNSKANPSIFGGWLNEAPKAFLFGGTGCDGVDNNCDGFTDEGMAYPFYQDSDGDGYGNAAVAQSVCIGKAPPAGYVRDGGDCNDAAPAIHPNALEISCNAIDEDCIGGDYCGAACQTIGLYDFENGPQGWSLPSGWTIRWYSDPFLSGKGRRLGWAKESSGGYTGYSAAAAGSTSTTLVNIPNAVNYIQVELLFANSVAYDSNATPSETPDASAVVTVNLGGTTVTVGPTSSFDGGTHTLKIAVNPAWWKTQVQMSVTVTTPNSSSDSDAGYYIDNVKAVCN